MKLNVSKTKTMIVSRSLTMSPPLTIGGTVLKESDDLVILGVTFKSEVFYGQEPPSGESTTTECGVNY